MFTVIYKKAAPAHAMANARRLPLTRVLLAILPIAAILILAWVVLGLAGALALGSAFLIAAGIGRTIPSLRGSASWAAATVLEFALLLGASAGVAFLSPHLHSRAVHLAIVTLPALVGGTLLLFSARLNTPHDGSRMPSRWGVALSITTGVLAVAAWVSSRGPYHGIAWAMSGDARNHVAWIRIILSDGGINLNTLKTYPAAVNAFGAVIAGAGGRSGDTAEVILNDVHAIATTYVLAGIAIALLLAGALMEILPRAVRYGRRLPAPILVTLLIASAAAGSPFVLGMALVDGFVTAYGALSLALAAVVLALRFLAEPRKGLASLAFLTIATPLIFVSWTVLVIVPASLLLVTSMVAIRNLLNSPSERGTAPSPARTVLWWSAIVGALSTLAAIAAVVSAYWSKLTEAFVFPGRSSTPYPLMLPILFLITAGASFLPDQRRARRQMLVPVSVAVAGAISLLWLVQLPGPGITWTYYALKTNWLVCASLFWVPFVPIILWLNRAAKPATLRGRKQLSRFLSALSYASATLLLVGSATTAPEPLMEAARGWNQPSAQIVGQDIRAADKAGPFVLWEWSDPGNDRLGNFWGVLAWASNSDGEFAQLPGVQGGFVFWSYMYTGQISELCTLVKAAPGITVYTHAKDLSTDLRKSCPAGVAKVVTGE